MVSSDKQACCCDEGLGLGGGRVHWRSGGAFACANSVSAYSRGSASKRDVLDFRAINIDQWKCPIYSPRHVLMTALLLSQAKTHLAKLLAEVDELG